VLASDDPIVQRFVRRGRLGAAAPA